jgi:hypothetical protein
MSWSVTAVGRPKAVKAALVQQFADAKKSCAWIPEEAASVGHAEDFVNAQLDLLAPDPKSAVRVSASGSAAKESEHQSTVSRYASSSITVENIYGFVE